MIIVYIYLGEFEMMKSYKFLYLIIKNHLLWFIPKLNFISWQQNIYFHPILSIIRWQGCDPVDVDSKWWLMIYRRNQWNVCMEMKTAKR